MNTVQLKKIFPKVVTKDGQLPYSEDEKETQVTKRDPLRKGHEKGSLFVTSITFCCNIDTFNASIIYSFTVKKKNAK